MLRVEIIARNPAILKENKDSKLCDEFFHKLFPNIPIGKKFKLFSCRTEYDKYCLKAKYKNTIYKPIPQIIEDIKYY